jgi:hypothetical protein
VFDNTVVRFVYTRLKVVFTVATGDSVSTYGEA